MKRLLGLLAVLLFLVGCSSTPKADIDTTAVYQNAVSKLDEAKSYDMSVSFFYPEMKVFNEITSMGMSSVTMDVKMNTKSLTDLSTMEGYYKLSAGFISMESYIKDGYMYSDTFGMKMKTPLDLEEAGIPTMSLSTSLMVGAEDLADFSTKVNGDIVTYSMSLDSEEEVIEQALELGEVLNSGLAGMNANIIVQKILTQYEVNTTTGCVKSILVEMTMYDEGNDETGTLKAEIIINSVEPITLDFPDFSQYMDLSDFEE